MGKCIIGGSDSSDCCDDYLDWVSSGLECFSDIPMISALQEQCGNKLVGKVGRSITGSTKESEEDAFYQILKENMI